MFEIDRQAQSTITKCGFYKFRERKLGTKITEQRPCHDAVSKECCNVLSFRRSILNVPFRNIEHTSGMPIVLILSPRKNQNIVRANNTNHAQACSPSFSLGIWTTIPLSGRGSSTRLAVISFHIGFTIRGNLQTMVRRCPSPGLYRVPWAFP